MKMHLNRNILRTIAAYCMAFFGCLGFSSVACAADWRILVQPIGTENDPFLVDPVQLNRNYSAGKGPWSPGTSVTSIKTTVPQFFVRFYNPTAVLNSSRQEGSWVMRTNTVRGLNATQIRDLFALPNTPTMMTLGLSTTGVSLYTGIAGPIDGWGNGGGQQSQSFSGPYTTFFNAQSVTGSVLSYKTQASFPSYITLGSYLDRHLPPAYSDIESVYNALDVINNPESKNTFNNALKSIIPAGFDNIATSGTRAVLMHSQAIDDRIDLFAVREFQAGCWSKALRTSQQYSRAGFEGDITGAIIGADTKTAANILSGISLAWLQGSVAWFDNVGKATTDYYRLAAYSAIQLSDAFLQASLSTGSANGESSRNIHIGTYYQQSQYGPVDSPLATLSRTAQANYSGWNADVNLRGGYVLHASPLTILPTAAIGYLYQTRGGFNETGAESLDSNVSEAQYQTFHCNSKIRVQREFLLNDHQNITPYISFGWDYDKRIDDSAVTASINGWTDYFTIYSPRTDGHSFNGRGGLLMSIGKNFQMHVDYTNQIASVYNDFGFEGGVNWAF